MERAIRQVELSHLTLMIFMSLVSNLLLVMVLQSRSQGRATQVSEVKEVCSREIEASTRRMEAMLWGLSNMTKTR